MSESKLSFTVRLDDHSSLEQIGERVSRALDINLIISDDPVHEGAPVMETDVLGQWITLTYGPRYPDGIVRKKALPRPGTNELKCFRLVGYVREDYEKPWPSGVADISWYICRILRRKDSVHWYIATLDQKLMEAGTDPNDPAIRKELGRE